ncbi:MAG: arginine--tRNA ligase [Methanocalculus sp. MSAO_Arc1]|uniref:arginine--tRNA ligase n=1 Tax=Methanocalculus TaxID=71151 RepID=UPI000FF37761|nr:MULTISPECIES: arginine--tRNA ligase [unclassified Methanocalculus]MCP1662659.1 arginyl-tRNA synthetase [Methanocalculus sp. AMF5]RQD80310.1 MAG: arginine--tRNA ligase [Methanocalculus sp. MSAO_Arc1]
MFSETADLIGRVLKACTGEHDPLLVDGGDHADLASTVAFALAKKEKRPPAQVAADLLGRLKGNSELKGISISAAGPYLNFVFGPEYVSSSVEMARKPGYGSGEKKHQRVSIEHTSANPNGPLHVGHIRNTVIGDTLARAFRKAGYPLEVQYYLNDMGRQIAIVVFGLSTLGIERKPDEKGDHFTARVYVQANRAIEADASINIRVEELMKGIEQGDPSADQEFREAVDCCTEGIRETLLHLNADHDRYVRESTFVRIGDMQRVLDLLSRQDEAENDGGLFALDLSSSGFEKKYVLRRADGTSVYAARDLAYHIWKNANYDRVIDVLGADHKLIGSQLQATLRLIGERPPEILHFEFVSLPEGAMSTRSGTFISADDLISEVTQRAFEEVTKRRPDLPQDERQAIARSVAVGAIRYDIIRVSPEKSTVFDWKQALDFERQSAPYIQYAHARASSILAKAGSFADVYTYDDPHEIALAKALARFPVVLDTVVTDLRPHLLATYIRDLADLFNSFYRFVPVLKAEGERRDARLCLVDATRNTLREALETLGIDALESM